MFHIFNSIFLGPVYAPGTSVITVLHYYHHIVLNFCQMNSVFGGYFFLRVLLFGKYFFGCSVSGKVFFWVVQKYPIPLIPVCRFIKSTPGIKSKTLDIIALYLLTGSAAYKMATVKYYILGFHM